MTGIHFTAFVEDKMGCVGNCRIENESKGCSPPCARGACAHLTHVSDEANCHITTMISKTNGA